MPERGAAGDQPGDPNEHSAAAEAQWSALEALPPGWEKKMLARRDAALRALADPGAAVEYVKRIDKAAAGRQEALLELRVAVGLAVEASG